MSVGIAESRCDTCVHQVEDGAVQVGGAGHKCPLCWQQDRRLSLFYCLSDGGAVNGIRPIC